MVVLTFIIMYVAIITSIIVGDRRLNEYESKSDWEIEAQPLSFREIYTFLYERSGYTMLTGILLITVYVWATIIEKDETEVVKEK